MRSAFHTIHAFLSLKTLTALTLIRVLTMIYFGTFAFQVMAQQWGTEIRLTDHPGNSYWPDITTDSKNNIHVVWWDDRNDNNYEIHYMKLDRAAKIVVGDTRITFNPSPSMYPRIIADSHDNIHIVWRSTEIGYLGKMGLYYTKFNKDGKPLFENRVLVEGTGDATNSLIPAIDVDSKDNLHILWDQAFANGGKEICYTKLNSSGKIVINKLVITPFGIHAREPAIAVDKDNDLHAAWVDNTAPPPEPLVRYWVVKYMKLDNNGKTLVEPFPITPALKADSRYPALIADRDNNIHCFFSDYREYAVGRWEVFYKKLNNVGNTVIDDNAISKTSQNSSGADIALDSQENIHLTWFEDYYGLTDEIYYAKINKQGKILISTTRVDNSTSKVEYPRIAIDNQDRVHLVWSDKRNGNWDIYYRYVTAGTTEVTEREKDKDSQKLPTTYELHQNYPNPFGIETAIGYYLPRDTHITLSIYNSMGELVIHLVNGRQSAGYRVVNWNGRNDKNKPVADGIYFYKLIVHSAPPFAEFRNDYISVKKMVLVGMKIQ